MHFNHFGGDLVFCDGFMQQKQQYFGLETRIHPESVMRAPKGTTDDW